MKVKPEDVKNKLNQDQFKLYELIWKRTIASQMAQSKSLETTYILNGGNFVLKATGSVEIFKGFKKIYDYSDKNDDQQPLPNLETGHIMNKSKVDIKQNFTKPPNRFSEAGLIKEIRRVRNWKTLNLCFYFY